MRLTLYVTEAYGHSFMESDILMKTTLFITCGLSGYACVAVVFVQPKIEHIVLTCLSPVIAVSGKTALPFCLLLNVFLFNYFLCEIIMSHQRVT